MKSKDLSKQDKPKNSEEIVVVSQNHTQYGYKVQYTMCIVGRIAELVIVLLRVLY